MKLHAHRDPLGKINFYPERSGLGVQHAILRPLPAEIGGMAFASHYQSATTQALVGGDLYDLAMTQFGPRFIIGDVKGKGLDAVGRCAAVLAVFRSTPTAWSRPGTIQR